MNVKETSFDSSSMVFHNYTMRPSTVESERKLPTFVDVACAGHALCKHPWSEHSYALNEALQHDCCDGYGHSYMTGTRGIDHSYSTAYVNGTLPPQVGEVCKMDVSQRRASTGSESRMLGKESLDDQGHYMASFALKSRLCCSLEVINSETDSASNKKDIAVGLSDPDISRIVLESRPNVSSTLPLQTDFKNDHSYAVKNSKSYACSGFQSLSKLPQNSGVSEADTNVRSLLGHSEQLWGSGEITANAFLKSPFLDHCYQLVERKRLKVKNTITHSPFLDHSYQSVNMQKLKTYHESGTRHRKNNEEAAVIYRSMHSDHTYKKLAAVHVTKFDMQHCKPLYRDHAYETKTTEQSGKFVKKCATKALETRKVDHAYFLSSSKSDSGTLLSIQGGDAIDMNLIQFQKDHTYTTR